jgi:mannose-6-phosphate isomerase-like protein (cupin superfamily)
MKVSFKKLKLMLWYLLLALLAYIPLSLLVHYIIFPFKEINYASYFKPGDTFNSVSEGFDQTVLASEGEWLTVRLMIQPFAPGPPEHVHESFDETFTVKKGELSMMVDGKVVILRAGQTLSIPKGTPHKPFNATGGQVVVESDSGKNLPTKFAYYLSQFYPYMDSFDMDPNEIPTSKILLQMSVYGSEMDTWLAGPPVGVQKAIRFILAPTARLLGYERYREPQVSTGR